MIGDIDQLSRPYIFDVYGLMKAVQFLKYFNQMHFFRITEIPGNNLAGLSLFFQYYLPKQLVL